MRKCDGSPEPACSVVVGSALRPHRSAKENARPGRQGPMTSRPALLVVFALSLAWITMVTIYLYPGVGRSMRRLSRLPFRYGLGSRTIHLKPTPLRSSDI